MLNDRILTHLLRIYRGSVQWGLTILQRFAEMMIHQNY